VSRSRRVEPVEIDVSSERDVLFDNVDTAKMYAKWNLGFTEYISSVMLNKRKRIFRPIGRVNVTLI